MTAPPTSRRRTRTLRECADEIGVSIDLVRDWVHDGELTAKFCGNKYLVLDKVLQKFIDDYFGGAQDGAA